MTPLNHTSGLQHRGTLRTIWIEVGSPLSSGQPGGWWPGCGHYGDYGLTRSRPRPLGTTQSSSALEQRLALPNGPTHCAPMANKPDMDALHYGTGVFQKAIVETIGTQ